MGKTELYQKYETEKKGDRTSIYSPLPLVFSPHVLEEISSLPRLKSLNIGADACCSELDLGEAKASSCEVFLWRKHVGLGSKGRTPDFLAPQTGLIRPGDPLQRR